MQGTMNLKYIVFVGFEKIEAVKAKLEPDSARVRRFSKNLGATSKFYFHIDHTHTYWSHGTKFDRYGELNPKCFLPFLVGVSEILSRFINF
jgi:hypothetical protein